MELDKPYRLFERIVKTVSWFANGLGAIALTIMMLLILTDVLMRYLFNRPVQGCLELVEFTMALAIALGMAYTGVRKGHIAVELVLSRFSPRVQATFDIFHFLIATVLFLFMSWKTAQQALVVGKHHVTTSVLAIPVYPFICVLSFCAGLLGLVFFLNFMESVSQAMKK